MPHRCDSDHCCYLLSSRGAGCYCATGSVDICSQPKDGAERAHSDGRILLIVLRVSVCHKVASDAERRRALVLLSITQERSEAHQSDLGSGDSNFGRTQYTDGDTYASQFVPFVFDRFAGQSVVVRPVQERRHIACAFFGSQKGRTAKLVSTGVLDPRVYQLSQVPGETRHKRATVFGGGRVKARF